MWKQFMVFYNFLVFTLTCTIMLCREINIPPSTANQRVLSWMMHLSSSNSATLVLFAYENKKKSKRIIFTVWANAILMCNKTNSHRLLTVLSAQYSCISWQQHLLLFGNYFSLSDPAWVFWPNIWIVMSQLGLINALSWDISKWS